MIETLEKCCLACGMQLQGRSDKKFCSDQCRSAHYHRMNFESLLCLKRTNNQLRRNWRILAELNSEGKTKTREDELRLRGFDFNYFTSIYRTQDGNTYYYCYDQGYLNLGKGQYLLVKKVSGF